MRPTVGLWLHPYNLLWGSGEGKRARARVLTTFGLGSIPFLLFKTMSSPGGCRYGRLAEAAMLLDSLILSVGDGGTTQAGKGVSLGEAPNPW